MANHSPAVQPPVLTVAPMVKPQHSRRLQQFERDLPKIILTSKTPEHALNGLLERLGDVLDADLCVLGILNREQVLTQSLDWCPQNIPSFSQGCSPLFSLLNLPEIQAQFEETKIAIIADLHALLEAQDANTDSLEHDVRHLLIAPEAVFPSIDRIGLVSCFPQSDPPQVRSVLIAEIPFQGRNNGILFLTRLQPYQWAKHDVQLVETLSDQLAIAISQMKLEQQIQRQIGYQTVLDQLTGAVRQDWKLEQIFQLAIEGVVSALQVNQGMVLLFKYADPSLKGRTGDRIAKTRATVEAIFPLTYDELSCNQPTPNSTTLESQTNPELHHWLKQSFQLANCDICRQLFTNVDKPITVPALHQASTGDLVFTVAPIFNLETMPTLLVMPLENQGTILGCLAFQQRQHRFWQSEELAFVKLIAAQVSTAIIQTRTLHQVHLLVEERTAQLRHSLDVQAKLYEKSRQQVEQLRRLNQMMEEFLSTVSHELLTPLTSMKLAIRMLREANLTPEQQERYLHILETQCTQETQLISDLLALQKLESNSVGIQAEQIDLCYVIRDIQQSWLEPMAEREVTLELHLPNRPLMMRTEPDSLHRILTELLTNARKYSDSGSKINLTVLSYLSETERSVPQVAVQLCNIGAGITPEELPVIFEKFRRGQNAT